MKRTYYVTLELEIDTLDDVPGLEPGELTTLEQLAEMLNRGGADSVLEQWVTDLWCTPPFNMVKHGILRLHSVASDCNARPIVGGS